MHHARHSLVLLVLGALVSIASAAKITDNFNDNARAAFWKTEKDKVDLREKNQRLEFKSQQTGGGLRLAGYRAKNWQFDFTRKFTIKFDYQLDVGSVSGSKLAFVGVRAIPSGEYDEAFVFIQREASGLYVVYESYIDGVLDTRAFAPISDASGTVKIRYKAGADRLDIVVNGTREVTVSDFLLGVDVGNGLSDLSIGAGRQGYVNWSWDDVSVDNFLIKGRIVD